MPCIFLKDGQCNNPNRNLDFECNFDLPSDCSDGVGDHYIEVQDNNSTGSNTLIVTKRVILRRDL